MSKLLSIDISPPFTTKSIYIYILLVVKGGGVARMEGLRADHSSRESSSMPLMPNEIAATGATGAADAPTVSAVSSSEITHVGPVA